MSISHVPTTTGHDRRRLLRIPLVVAFIVAIPTIGAALADADGDTYTGCLTKSGELVNVAIGDKALEPCGKKDTQVQWSQVGPMGPAGTGASFYGRVIHIPPPDMEPPDPIPYDGPSVREIWATGEYVAACDPGDVVIDFNGYSASTQATLDGSGFVNTDYHSLVFDPIMVGDEAPNAFVNRNQLAVSHAFEISSSWPDYEEHPTEYTTEVHIFLTCADTTP